MNKFKGLNQKQREFIITSFYQICSEKPTDTQLDVLEQILENPQEHHVNLLDMDVDRDTLNTLMNRNLATKLYNRIRAYVGGSDQIKNIDALRLYRSAEEGEPIVSFGPKTHEALEAYLKHVGVLNY